MVRELKGYLDSVEKAIVSFRKLRKAMDKLKYDVSQLDFSLKETISKLNLKDLRIKDGIIDVEPLSSSRGF